MGQIQNAFTGAVSSIAIAKMGYDNRIATETAAASRGISQLRKGEDRLQAEEMKFDEYQNFGDKKGNWDETKSAKWQEKLEERRTELTRLRELTFATYEKLPKRAQRLAQTQAAAAYSKPNKGRKLDIKEDDK